uniref:Uncharacterized protein n=1 Tax=Rhizophora mucronata TaxID=61149 RepID=A0A2P2Q6Z7_RHIMU
MDFKVSELTYPTKSKLLQKSMVLSVGFVAKEGYSNTPLLKL